MALKQNNMANYIFYSYRNNHIVYRNYHMLVIKKNIKNNIEIPYIKNLAESK